MTCVCGCSATAHALTGCLTCEDCREFRDETEIIFTEADKKEWAKIKRRVGIKRRGA